MGVAGSGKSTLARAILHKVQAVYLDNNYIADAFFPDSRQGSRYEKLRPHFYEALYAITKANLHVGNSVLLDVPHVKEMQDPQWQRYIKRLAAQAKSRTVVIRCYCSEKVLYGRLQSRREKRDQWKLRHWKEFMMQQPIGTAVPFPHLNIDTEKKLSKNVAAAVRYILKVAGTHRDRVRDPAAKGTRTLSARIGSNS
jgi:predicted kinase